MQATQSRSTEPTGAANPMASGVDFPIALGRTALQAWMDIGSEAVRFVSDRMQQDLKAQQALLACTSLDEVREVQVEFFRSAQVQYAAEARRMLDMMEKAATGGLARKYDDVPL